MLINAGHLRTAFKDPSSGVAYVGDLMFRGHPEENLDEFTANAKSRPAAKQGKDEAPIEKVAIWLPLPLKWHETIYDDMIWYDMIWYDMIWYDMIWYDMIWYDDHICCKCSISTSFRNTLEHFLFLLVGRLQVTLEATKICWRIQWLLPFGPLSRNWEAPRPKQLDFYNKVLKKWVNNTFIQQSNNWCGSSPTWSPKNNPSVFRTTPFCAVWCWVS